MPGTSHGNLEQALNSLSSSELEKMKKLAQMDPAGLEKILRDLESTIRRPLSML